MFQPSAQPDYYRQFTSLSIAILARMENEEGKRKNSVGSKLKRMGQQVKDKAGSAAAVRSYNQPSSSRTEKHKVQASVEPTTEIDRRLGQMVMFHSEFYCPIEATQLLLKLFVVNQVHVGKLPFTFNFVSSGN